eukprot:1881004-Rhodomonas_salina.1
MVREREGLEGVQCEVWLHKTLVADIKLGEVFVPRSQWFDLASTMAMNEGRAKMGWVPEVEGAERKDAMGERAKWVEVKGDGKSGSKRIELLVGVG